ncbi:transposase [Burkholderia cepacia]|uniref:transposase n=1 Tax=Burkholderia cepacia TaxID=292 RepID=UPI0018C8CF7B|nr:transposase [Burkholderia cepacia]
MDDETWAQIESVLPGRACDPGRTAADNRWFVEAVLWVGRTRRPWSDLPEEFGRWQTIYLRFWRWRQSGVWDRVARIVSDDTEFKRVLNDSFILRPYQRGGVRSTV